MEKIQKSPRIYYDANATLNGKPAYRQFTPLPMKPYCLSCHGTMKDNPLNKGKSEEQWTDIDMTGFKNFPSNNRGKRELQEGNIDLLLPFDDDVDKDIKLLTKPLFHSIPGLCFKKEKFIPILSATHRFKALKIGVPVGIDVVSTLKDSGAHLITLQGNNTTNRGIDLTQRGRLDAFYHPSPLKMYYQNNQVFREVVCSYFHGFPNAVHIAASATMKQRKFDLLNALLTQAINELSYEYYFAR